MSNVTKKRIDYWYYLAVIVLALIIYLYFALNINLLVIKPTKSNVNLSSATSPLNINWPNFKEEAYGINNSVYQTNGNQVALPTASTAKLITALVVLQKYPLQPGQSGPLITINQNDMNDLAYYEANQGSVLKVYLNEQLSEYQMLQAMLLPSANNIADSLATWAFGSLQNYASNANQFLVKNGFNNTYVGTDASGFNPSTTSTAKDLVRLGEMAYDNPVLANIVALKSATNFPLVGSIKNVNFLLGQDGIMGIKTGNNNQDPGVFIAVSKQNINNQAINIFTAVMGAPDLWYALNGTVQFINSIKTNFSTPISLNTNNLNASLGTYYVPWDKQNIKVYLAKSINFKILNNSKATIDINMNPISFKTKMNQTIGYLSLNGAILKQKQIVPIKLAGNIKKPPLWWLLLHPNYVL